MPLPKRTLNDEETFRLIENICLRPRMYYSEAYTFRDVLAFINGVTCGMHPDHGCFVGFAEVVWEKLGASRQRPWAEAVLDAYSDLPKEEACEALACLFREWKGTLP